MTIVDTQATEWEALRALVADAWQARSPEERQAYGPELLGEAAERSAPAPTLKPDGRRWSVPDPGLTLAASGAALELPEAVREELTADTALLPRDRFNPAPDDEPVDPTVLGKAFARVELVAALSGAVAPPDLVAGLPPELGHAVLDQLAPHSDRTLVDAGNNRWRWVLGAPRRRAVLSAADPQALADALVEAAGVATDAAGRLLRDCARGIAPDPEALRTAPLTKLQVVVQALAWAEPLNPAFTSKLAAVRQAAAVADLVAAYDQLLADGFVGRERQAARIRAFIHGLPAARTVGHRIPILGICGIGGSGKSTLLAHVLRPLVADASGTGPIVVAIDFDRQRFIDGGELEWSFELSRQIGLFVPETSKALAHARDEAHAARARRGEFGKQDGARLESVVRDDMGFLEEVGGLLNGVSLAGRQLVLILDTFEEWQRDAWTGWNPDTPAWRVLEWVGTVATALGMGLGMIVSGRAPLRMPGFTAEADPVELDDLPHREAVQVLVRLGLQSGAARRMTALIGRNPLSLKLAARHYLALPAGRRDSVFAEDGEEITGLSAAMRQGLLYRRFLNHIPDGDVRKLAHPGLALRQVTPLLIRQVLAGPCGLGAMTEERAEELISQLEREVWLVERRGVALVHRPDVRRVMLRHMADDPAFEPQIRAVHEAAARWFAGDGADPLEAAYHRLALGGEDAKVKGAVPAELLVQLASAAGDFPARIAAWLRDRAGLRINAAEAALLPEDRRLRWTEARAINLVERGQPAGALRFWQKGRFGAVAKPWYVQAAFQAPDWTLPVHFADLPTDAELRRGSLAYAYLLAFSREDERRRQKDLTDVGGVLADQLSGRLARPVTETILENTFFHLVTTEDRLEAHAPAIERIARTSSLALKGLTATDIRRLAIVSPDNPALEAFDVRHVLAQGFRPSPSWVLGLAEPLNRLGANVEPLIAFHAELAGAGDVETATLLGAFAERFADAVRSGFVVPPSTPTLLRVLGYRSDDPEWRVPIRSALNLAFAHTDAFEAFVGRLPRLFEILPSDLVPGALLRQHRRAPRAMWLRLVEFADRCGVLRQLIEMAGDAPVLRPLVSSYGRWDEACLAMVARVQARPGREASK